jgi:hypothetical protein
MNNKEIRNLVLDDQDNFASIVSRCAIMEELYLKEKESLGLLAESTRQLRTALVTLYESILRY